MNLSTRAQNAGMNYTHTFSPSMMNELRFGVTQLVGRPEVRKHLEVPGVNITGATGFSGALYPRHSLAIIVP